MKKVIFAVLGLVMMTSLVSCGHTTNEDDKSAQEVVEESLVLSQHVYPMADAENPYKLITEVSYGMNTAYMTIVVGDRNKIEKDKPVEKQKAQDFLDEMKANQKKVQEDLDYLNALE